jgi:hypothetical protein
MTHYNGPAGWISATVKAPKPGSLAWKLNTVATRMHVRIFQRTGGRIGGTLDGAPLLVLHHTGAKTGARRQSPAIHMRDGENLVVVASLLGAPKNPALAARLWQRSVELTGVGALAAVAA